jgi:hypothetical protein
MFFSFTLLKARKTTLKVDAESAAQNNFQNLESEPSWSETGFSYAISALLDRFFSIKAGRMRMFVSQVADKPETFFHGIEINLWFFFRFNKVNIQRRNNFRITKQAQATVSGACWFAWVFQDVSKVFIL